MMPSSKICSNYLLAIARPSPASRRGLPKKRSANGVHVKGNLLLNLGRKRTWWCNRWSSARACTQLGAGRSARAPATDFVKRSHSRNHLLLVTRLVISSERRRYLTLTFKLRNDRKSDPVARWATTAIANTYRKVRRSPLARVGK